VQLKYYLKVIEEVDPVLIFFFAITNITPEFLLFPLKMAGIVNEVAMPISFKKQIIFAVKWAIKLIKTRYRIISYKQLCLLFLLANREKGIAMKKKLQTQQEAIRNRYLVRYFK
jgi:ribosomal protein S7